MKDFSSKIYKILQEMIALHCIVCTKPILNNGTEYLTCNSAMERSSNYLINKTQSSRIEYVKYFKYLIYY